MKAKAMIDYGNLILNVGVKNKKMELGDTYNTNFVCSRVVLINKVLYHYIS